jgi:hypothetical protein
MLAGMVAWRDVEGAAPGFAQRVRKILIEIWTPGSGLRRVERA